MKILIAYFSLAGQNYYKGSIRNLSIGNTEVVAKKIHALIDSDLFNINTVNQYPDDYTKRIEIAKQELYDDARPQLTDRVENMNEYDTVIVAFPNWWSTMPMALFTFFESYDFTDKTICPLITHGGSGFSKSINDIRRLCPHSIITEGLAILGEDAENSDKDIDKWIKNIGLQ